MKKSEEDAGIILKRFYKDSEEMTEVANEMSALSEELTEKILKIAKESVNLLSHFKEMEKSYKKLSEKASITDTPSKKLKDSKKNKIISDQSKELSGLTSLMSDRYKNMSERLRKLSKEVSEICSDLSERCVEISLKFKRDSEMYNSNYQRFKKS
jgi:methyl-accepting chemotaxis protein